MNAGIKRFFQSPAVVAISYLAIIVGPILGLKAKWSTADGLTRGMLIALCIASAILCLIKVSYLVWSVRNGRGIPKE